MVNAEHHAIVFLVLHGDEHSDLTTVQLEDNVPAQDGAVISDADIEAVRSSMRLFVRNLPYDVRREDLEAEFAPFENLEEVRFSQFPPIS